MDKPDVQHILQMIQRKEISPEEGVKRFKSLPYTESQAGNDTSVSDLLYCTEVWDNRELGSTEDSGKEQNHILLFDLNTEGYDHLKKILRSNQLSGNQASLVIPGASYQELGEGIYQIRPGQQGDYDRLFEALRARGAWPFTVLHLWSRSGSDSAKAEQSGADSLDQLLKRGLYSLFFISKAWLGQGLQTSTKLIYLHTSAVAGVQPAYAAVSGMVKSVLKEQPGWMWKTVEVQSQTDAEGRGFEGEDSSSEAARLLDIAWQEAREIAPIAADIRYAGAVRQIRNFKEAALPEEVKSPFPLRNEGIYLITGGLGGLGRIIAASIAGRVNNPKLALSGRSRLDEKGTQLISDLERQGAEVLYLQGDVSNREQTQDIIARIKARWGGLNGVIHSAGVNRDSLLQHKTEAEMESVLATKVRGTLHLDEATAAEELDLFVLFSSIAGIAGNAGQIDYAFGNRYMDHFASQRSQQRKGRSLSLIWPLWEEGGMQPSDEEKALLKEAAGLEALPTNQGLRAWERALQLNGTQYAVLYGNREQITGMLKVQNEAQQLKKSERAVQEQHADVKRTEVDSSLLTTRIEKLLKELFGQLIKLPASRLDLDTSFQDYGVDSVMVKRFNDLLEQQIGPVSTTLLFEYRTLRELAASLAMSHSGQFAEALHLHSNDEAASMLNVDAKAEVVMQVAERATGQTAKQAGQATDHTTTPAVSEQPGSTTGDVAIIGVSGRYPQAADLSVFWDNLKEGKDCIREIPAERWDYHSYYDPDTEAAIKGKMYCKWGGFVDDADRFDSLFFNISPKEAGIMDPQERLFLETVWSTLEDAGYTREAIAKRNLERKLPGVGVFAGVTTNSYQLWGPEQLQQGETSLSTSFPWSIANRISYYFDFRGPSIPVDTACSSSLTAIHMACESLAKGECSMAIAGGVNLYLHPLKYIVPSQKGMLSASGKCSSFGVDADGYVPGEGAGAVLLKPLEQAERDGDYIYGVIKGTSVNHGGASNGYTVPSLSAQAELIRDTLRKADIDPRTISYIEAHGTGTVLGDPIEVNALTKAYSEFTQDRQYCSIGSAKSNIGHLEAAAGIAGLTKVLLQMKNGQLVPSLHAEVTNPNIRFEESPFYVQQELADWQPFLKEQGKITRIPRRAGISSFGAGGANAHIIVEEYNSAKLPVNTGSAEAQVHIVPLSAKNEKQLLDYAQRLLHFLEQKTAAVQENENETGFMERLAYTLQTGREPMEARAALLASGLKELIAKLQAYVQDNFYGEGILQGSDRRSTLGKLPQDEDMNGMLRNWAAKGKLIQIADFWVNGGMVDWPSLSGKQVRKLPLPAYPFAGERYWLPQHSSSPMQGPLRTQELHPLVHTNVSTLLEHKYISILKNKQPFIYGNGLIAGFAFVEAGLAAGGLAVEQHIRNIRNVEWSERAAHNGDIEELLIRVYPAGEDLQYEVEAKDGQSEEVVLSQGVLLLNPFSSGPSGMEETLNLQEIKQRCGKEWTGGQCYERFQTAGMDYEPSFRSIQQIVIGKKEALAQLRLPSDHVEPEPGRGGLTLQPVLMDGILQSIAVLLSAGDDNRLFVYSPRHLNHLELRGTLKDICMVYVTKSSGQAIDARPNDSVFDVHVTNLEGNLLLRLERLQVRQLERNAVSGISTSADVRREPAVSTAVLASSLLCCTEAWVERKLNRPAQPSGEAGHVLLFDVGTGGYQHLKSRLLAEGQTGRQLSLVIPGTSYQELGNGIYHIRPDQAADYEALFQNLRTRGAWPGTVLHLWSCGGAEEGKHSGGESLQWQLQRSLYSLFAIGKMWLNERGASSTKLIYMHTSGSEGARPAYSAIGGMAKSVMMEHPGWLWKTVDVRPEFTDAAQYAYENGLSAAGVQLLDIAWQEAEEGSSASADIRYDGKVRQVRVFKEVPSELESGNRPLPLKDGGVYLITGGLGGLGRIIASSITRLVKQPKLALSGRTRLNEDGANVIRELERQGAEILYVQGDVSDKKQTLDLLAAIRTRWGQLDGVIHCAGVNRDSLLRRKTDAEIEAVLAAKVYGTIHLDEATTGDGLELFVLFSSIAGIAGNSGQSDYAYANSFMDHFAKARSLRSGGRTLTLNWPLWEEGGMQLQAEEKAVLRAVSGLEPLPTAYGLQAWETALRLDGSQYAIFYGDRERIARLLEGTQEGTQEGTKKFTTGAITAVPTNADFGESIEPAEELLRTIFGEVIGMSAAQIDMDTNFQDYGVDSVMVKQFNAMLERKIGPVSTTLLFEYRTIRELARYIAAHHSSIFAEAQPSMSNSNNHKSTGWEKLSPFGKSRERQPDRIRESLRASRSERTQRSGDVAIIGISGRYPQAAELSAFWDNLKAGKNSITEIPGDRWDYRSYYNANTDELPEGKMYCKWGGFVEGVERFDPLFFNISPREAENMDPQERIFIETVWSTLEDAGYTRGGISRRIREENLPGVGVFAGITTNSYQLLGPQEWSKGNMITPSSFPWSIANRISYLFDFNGPSIPVDTACSSSLTAIHMACESLLKGECSMAVAGGVNLYLHPMKYVMASQLRMLSAKGQCSSFGAEADGYVPGEGAGAVLLKPLEQAERDGDYIYGVIKGTSINHGGATNGYTVPSLNAQADLVKDAVRKAGIDPRTISYIEAHGTGTVLGDPIEVNGLTKAFREFTGDTQYCAIGSAKSNIGHLEAAAGIAGLTKVLLQMKHKQLVPSLHADVINPNIRFEETPFYVQRELTDWLPVLNQDGAARPIPRRAGISSFGAGGANAHIIVEEYRNDRQADEISSRQETPFYIIPLSARNTETLQVYARKLAAFVDHNPTSIAAAGVDEHVLVPDAAFGDQAAIIATLSEITREVFGIEGQDLQSDDPVVDYSSDPLVLSEWLSRINRTYRRELDHMILHQYPSLQSLGEYLYSTNRSAVIQSKQSLQGAVPSGEKAANSNHLAALDELAYTLQTGREPMACRVAFVVRNLEELSAGLHAYINDIPSANVHRSEPLSAGGAAEALLNGSIGDIVAAELIKSKKFAEIAQLWAAHVNFDWNKLYTNRHPHKMPLPSYPFSGSRYWVEISGEASMSRSVADKKDNELVTITAAGDSFANSSNNSSLSDGMLYFPGWSKAPLLDEPRNAAKAAPQHIVIVSARQGELISSGLAEAHSQDNVVQLVMGGSTFPPSAPARTGPVWDIDLTDSNAFERCIGTMKKIDLLYFISVNEAAELDREQEGLRISQEEGVMALFGLFKTLDKSGFAEEELTVKVITNNVCGVNPSDSVIPYGGSIHGFMYSMTKEFTNLRISCVDIDIAELDVLRSSAKDQKRLIDSIMNEPPHPIGKVTALRQNQRLIPTMFPLALPEIAQTPFRPKGVYFILGGAGGIGMELAKFLARKVRARVVLVGRRKLGSEHLQKIKEIEACGGEALYLSADATSLDSMRAAVAEAKSQFGGIHGVVHSAIVLQDKTLPGMDEESFRKTLAPKVQGSVVLAQAFEDEPLDFMLFFSSAQSFTGNPGQSNYAAGCTFKDAYAQYLRSKLSYPVITYNWGYWGTVGVVAFDSYQQRFAAQGVGSIEPEEGMFVVEQALAARTGQVVPLKADKWVLEAFGFELNRRIELCPEEAPSMLGRWKLEAERVLLESRSPAHSRETFIDASAPFISWYVQERLNSKPQEAIRILNIGADPDPQLSQLLLSLPAYVEYKCAGLKDSLAETVKWDLILWSGPTRIESGQEEWLLQVKRLLKRNGVFALTAASDHDRTGEPNGEWVQAMQSAGMNPVLSVYEPHLLVGESDGMNFTDHTRTFAVPSTRSQSETESRSTAPSQPQRNNTAGHPAVIELATDYIKTVFAQVLKLNKEDIDPKASFERYGVDSIMVMELNRRLRKDFGKLPSTLLYEHTTVEQLARYMEQEHASGLLQISGVLEDNLPEPIHSWTEIAAGGRSEQEIPPEASAQAGESEVDSLVDEMSDDEVDALLERLLKR
ncbi:SDR family NAD(P)-dependent oxidoreductase [Paenibacillus durus]|uniref:SDR family NAD(P)-dependent oxidoreductase n=1 Tax=Paenibacillus durus TaxID=44251 RepID=UPI0005A6054A|nr:SDR family NAD(P)-dependent oxidoreductase [Paenibacillus durus]